MSPPSRFHVLLVGIDDYPAAPLRGCVNDVDAIQRLLVGRLGLPRDRIRRLVSPRQGVLHDTSVPGLPATGANLRAALAELGSAEVADGDRVFVYYSGHGTRATVARAGGGVFHREALVPVDVTTGVPASLVFDHELNAALVRIVERTRSVTVVLDCCHAAGATRGHRGELLDGATGGTGSSAAPAVRFIDLALDLGWTELLREPTPREATRGHGLVRQLDACQVVSACLEHEVAYEELGPEGLRNGLFTRALVSALGGVRSEELGEVRWTRIWHALSVDIESVRPGQHPRLIGSLARGVFSGAPVDGDPGFALARTGGDAYLVHAGSLAGITTGAVVAVYGESTARFAPLDSPGDRAARLGVIRVASATPASAVASADTPFELPRGARGRLVRAGAPARLACSIVPPHAAVLRSLRASPLLEVVAHAAVKLVQVGGRWLLGDGLHAPTRASALAAIDQHDLAGCRAVLEHYFHYSLPLRMAERVRDLPGALELTVLACPSAIAPAAAQDAALPEAASPGTGTYDLHSGDRVCFRIANTSHERLRVTLLNAAASGKVQSLGDHIIDANAAYVWWFGGALGRPYSVDPMPGRTRWIDRLVAIGTTVLTKDLHHLRVDTSFADALEVMRDGGEPKEFGGAEKAGPPVELWTATQVVVGVALAPPGRSELTS